MPKTEAQKRANKKYAAKTYKNLQVSVRISDYELIDKYCKRTGISKATLIVEGCKMYMQAHEENMEKEEN